MQNEIIEAVRAAVKDAPLHLDADGELGAEARANIATKLREQLSRANFCIRLNRNPVPTGDGMTLGKCEDIHRSRLIVKGSDDGRNPYTPESGPHAVTYQHVLGSVINSIVWNGGSVKGYSILLLLRLLPRELLTERRDKIAAEMSAAIERDPSCCGRATHAIQIAVLNRALGVWNSEEMVRESLKHMSRAELKEFVGRRGQWMQNLDPETIGPDMFNLLAAEHARAHGFAWPPAEDER